MADTKTRARTGQWKELKVEDNETFKVTFVHQEEHKGKVFRTGGVYIGIGGGPGTPCVAMMAGDKKWVLPDTVAVAWLVDQGLPPQKAEHAVGVAIKRREAIDQLSKKVHPGDTVYTLVRKRDRQNIGMCIAVLIVTSHNTIRNIAGLVSEATGLKWDDCGGVWHNSEFDIVQQISFAAHGTDDVGNPQQMEQQFPNSVPSSAAYKAGYSLHHRQL